MIVDLDGTLCDDSHRRCYIEGKSKNYEAYHEACIDDAANRPLLEQLQRFAAEGVHIIYLTGRPEAYRSITLDWLVIHDAPCGLLFMKRMDQVFQPVAEYKRDVIETELKSLDIGYGFDDNDKVLEMYKSIGIEGVKVSI